MFPIIPAAIGFIIGAAVTSVVSNVRKERDVKKFQLEIERLRQAYSEKDGR